MTVGEVLLVAARRGAWCGPERRWMRRADGGGRGGAGVANAAAYSSALFDLIVLAFAY
jgi:hypothetical protein